MERSRGLKRVSSEGAREVRRRLCAKPSYVSAPSHFPPRSPTLKVTQTLYLYLEMYPECKLAVRTLPQHWPLVEIILFIKPGCVVVVYRSFSPSSSGSLSVPHRLIQSNARRQPGSCRLAPRNPAFAGAAVRAVRRNHVSHAKEKAVAVSDYMPRDGCTLYQALPIPSYLTHADTLTSAWRTRATSSLLQSQSCSTAQHPAFPSSGPSAEPG